MPLPLNALRLPALFCLALAAGACGPPFIITDTFTPPPEGWDSAPDSLHDYAVGTEFGLSVRAARMFVDMNSTEVVSKNPDLLEVLSQEIVEDKIQVKLKALAPGTAGLNFLDDRQRPLEERVIEVKLPDEIVLGVNMDTEQGFTLPLVDQENLLVAVGGAVTFRVTYKAEGKEVKGKGVMVGVADGLTLENPTLEEPDREFLKLRAPPEPLGPIDVELKVDDQVITTLSVRVAPLSEISLINLDEGEPPAFRTNGTAYSVWAKAITSDAAPVFGAPFVWTFDGAEVDGDADLLTYTYEGGKRTDVQVRAGDTDTVEGVTVEAKAGTASLTSTEPVSDCSSVGTGAPLALALLIALRRRRR